MVLSQNPIFRPIRFRKKGPSFGKWSIAVCKFTVCQTMVDRFPIRSRLPKSCHSNGDSCYQHHCFICLYQILRPPKENNIIVVHFSKVLNWVQKIRIFTNVRSSMNHFVFPRSFEIFRIEVHWTPFSSVQIIVMPHELCCIKLLKLWNDKRCRWQKC